MGLNNSAVTEIPSYLEPSRPQREELYKFFHQHPELPLQEDVTADRIHEELETSVVTVGALHAGTKSNIIPASAELLITTRAYDDGVEKHLHEAIERIVRQECAASRSPREPEFTYYDTYPLTDNHPESTAAVRGSFDAFFGERSVDMDPVPASEDFSIIPDALGVPYVYWGIGGFADRENAPGNHNPGFAPDLQPTLDLGVQAIVVAAGTWLAGDTL